MSDETSRAKVITYHKGVLGFMPNITEDAQETLTLWGSALLREVQADIGTVRLYSPPNGYSASAIAALLPNGVIVLFGEHEYLTPQPSATDGINLLLADIRRTEKNIARVRQLESEMTLAQQIADGVAAEDVAELVEIEFRTDEKQAAFYLEINELKPHRKREHVERFVKRCRQVLEINEAEDE
jgi:hypothetical protein